MALLLALACAAFAEDDGEQVRQRFDAQYKNFFGSGSQALLPLPQLEKPEWEKLNAAQKLRQVFVEPDVFYNAKNYRFTLFQAEDGNYYLDAKGGFWGMDELFYGPIPHEQLQ